MNDSAWMVLYLSVIMAVLLTALTLVTRAMQDSAARPEDVAYVEKLARSEGHKVMQARRISGFMRIPIGGTFEFSNMARLYRISVQGVDGGEIIYFMAFDPLSGLVKRKRGAAWADT